MYVCQSVSERFYGAEPWCPVEVAAAWRCPIIDVYVSPSSSIPDISLLKLHVKTSKICTQLEKYASKSIRVFTYYLQKIETKVHIFTDCPQQ